MRQVCFTQIVVYTKQVNGCNIISLISPETLKLEDLLQK